MNASEAPGSLARVSNLSKNACGLLDGFEIWNIFFADLWLEFIERDQCGVVLVDRLHPRRPRVMYILCRYRLALGSSENRVEAEQGFRGVGRLGTFGKAVTDEHGDRVEVGHPASLPTKRKTCNTMNTIGTWRSLIPSSAYRVRQDGTGSCFSVAHSSEKTLTGSCSSILLITANFARLRSR